MQAVGFVELTDMEAIRITKHSPNMLQLFHLALENCAGLGFGGLLVIR